MSVVEHLSETVWGTFAYPRETEGLLLPPEISNESGNLGSEDNKDGVKNEEDEEDDEDEDEEDEADEADEADEVLLLYPSMLNPSMM